MTEKSLSTNTALMIAEKRIIAAAFKDSSILDKIDSSFMTHGNCASIIKAMEEMKKNGVRITKGSLLTKAADIDLNIDEELINFTTEDIGEDDIDDAVKILKIGKKRIEIIQKMKRSIAAIDASPIEDETGIAKAKEIIDEASDAFNLNTDDKSKKVYDMPEWMDSYEQDRQFRKNGKQYPFNCFMFDKLIPDGATPGTFGCVAAASGSGKSTIILKLARSLVNTDIPCMLFTLEMALIPTADRWLSAETGIPYADFVNSEDAASFDALSKEISEKRKELDQKSRFRICESADISLRELEKHIRQFQKDIGQNYCVVLIDLLSMVKEFAAAKPGMNYADSVTIATNQLSALVKNLGVHVVGVIQLNRSAESERAKTWDDLDKFRPMRAQIKSAGAYAERSRYVLGAFRKIFLAELFHLDPSEYAAQQDICEISTLKINNGKTGIMVPAIFDGEVFDLMEITNGISNVP
jgi:replicative DNA helicase